MEGGPELDSGVRDDRDEYAGLWGLWGAIDAGIAVGSSVRASEPCWCKRGDRLGGLGLLKGAESLSSATVGFLEWARRPHLHRAGLSNSKKKWKRPQEQGRSLRCFRTR